MPRNGEFCVTLSLIFLPKFSVNSMYKPTGFPRSSHSAMVKISLCACILLGVLSNKAFLLPRRPMITDYRSLQECILGYFNAGYSNKKIVNFLGTVNGVFMTVRSLRYLLNKVYGVYRQGNASPYWLIRRAIRRELDGPGKFAGYRFMTQLLRKKLPS